MEKSVAVFTCRWLRVMPVTLQPCFLAKKMDEPPIPQVGKSHGWEAKGLRKNKLYRLFLRKS
jgi:hypothetical protein